MYPDNVGDQGTHSPPSHVEPRGISRPSVMGSLNYLVMAEGR